MGNCLKSTSTDDLTLLNGRANDSNRESIDQDPNMHFPVSFYILKKKVEILRNLPLFCLLLAAIFISVFALPCCFSMNVYLTNFTVKFKTSNLLSVADDLFIKKTKIKITKYEV